MVLIFLKSIPLKKAHNNRLLEHFLHFAAQNIVLTFLYSIVHGKKKFWLLNNRFNHDAFILSVEL
ncbi:Uncharacterised protein [Legionella cherrii]|uniref:Uncharacterized protein n=1 Tax=Legionella cherrii TaxID=28084 RepID=A0ABY6T3H3_9GAMM|nr:Uncharacterised protein [Legionella cherrii]